MRFQQLLQATERPLLYMPQGFQQHVRQPLHMRENIILRVGY